MLSSPSKDRSGSKQADAALAETMGLVDPQQEQEHKKKKVKGCHVVPEDDWTSLQEPLRARISSSEEDVETCTDLSPRSSQRAFLASSRVARDRLMRRMEGLILKEAELSSAYELFDYTRQKCSQEHNEIVQRLELYEKLLSEVQARATESNSANIDELFTTDEERERWSYTKEMVEKTLPELLGRVEDSIDTNSAKIRRIQELMEDIRAERLAVREEIAMKEEDIALALG